VQCPYLDNFRKLIKDCIKADLHVDTFSMDIQNILLYNVKFKYYSYVYAYSHAIWSCRHNLQGDILHQHCTNKCTIVSIVFLQYGQL
jgi:hypothetical protein